jgi:hypothetical protein
VQHDTVDLEKLKGIVKSINSFEQRGVGVKVRESAEFHMQAVLKSDFREMMLHRIVNRIGALTGEPQPSVEPQD